MIQLCLELWSLGVKLDACWIWFVWVLQDELKSSYRLSEALFHPPCILWIEWQTVEAGWNVLILIESWKYLGLCSYMLHGLSSLTMGGHQLKPINVIISSTFITHVQFLLVNSQQTARLFIYAMKVLRNGRQLQFNLKTFKQFGNVTLHYISIAYCSDNTDTWLTTLPTELSLSVAF